MSQSTSSSMINAVEWSLARNVRSALRWPSQANADPRVIVEILSARNCEMSSSVQRGCTGIEISSPVMLAAKRSPSRRGDCWRETAMIEPN